MEGRIAGVDYLHPPMGRPEADTLMKNAGNTDGLFFVRTREPGQDGLVLGVVYRNQPTYHLMKWDDAAGIFTVNAKPLTDCATLKQSIDFLRTKRPFWPVPLTSAIPYTGTAIPVSGATASASTLKRQESTNSARSAVPPLSTQGSTASFVNAPAQAMSTTPSTSSIAKPESTSAGSTPVPVHPLIPKEEAERRLKVTDIKEGKFLVRMRAANSTTEYIVSVIYKTRPTHHLLNKDPSGVFAINGTKMPDVTTIDQVVVFLAKARPFWPVPLTEMVSPPAEEMQSAANTTPAATPRASTIASDSAPPADDDQSKRESEVLASVVDTLKHSGPAADDSAAQEAERAAAEQAKLQREQDEQTEHQKQQEAAEQQRKQDERRKQLELERQRQEAEQRKREEEEELARKQQQQQQEAVRQTEIARQQQEEDATRNAEQSRQQQLLQQQEEQQREQLRQQQQDEAERQRQLEHQQEQENERQRQQREEAAAREHQQQEEADKERQQEHRRQQDIQQQQQRQQQQEMERQRHEQAQHEEQQRQAAAAATAAAANKPQQSFTFSNSYFADSSTPSSPTVMSGYNSADNVTSPVSRQGTVWNRSNVEQDSQSNTILEEPVQSQHECPAGATAYSVTISRKQRDESFGFGVASVWTPEGRLNVVSFVSKDGLSEHKLLAADVIVYIGQEDVLSADLDDVKQILRATDVSLELKVWRGYYTSDAPQQVMSPQRTQRKPVKESPVKCSGSVWCPCPKCAKRQLEEESKLMRNTYEMARHITIRSPNSQLGTRSLSRNSMA